MKRVLDIGQCGMDHAAIRRLIEDGFDAEVAQAQDAADAVRQLRETPFDLVLVNRVLDADGSDGLSIIEQIKSDAKLAAIPVMLVTNFPEYQERAVAAGAEPGFGKAGLYSGETADRLAAYLDKRG
ncbi:MAG: response regulator [Pirellulales bacterium]